MYTAAASSLSPVSLLRCSLILLAVLPALFASDFKLSNTTPVYSEVSEEVVDALVHSSSLPLLVAAIAFSIWGVLAYLRCLDYVLRRRLVAIAAICALWMIEVILKYKSFTPFYATVLWYLYYVPITLIPLLYQLCGLRLAGWNSIVWGVGTAPFCGSWLSCLLALCSLTMFISRSFHFRSIEWNLEQRLHIRLGLRCRLSVDGL